MIYNVWHRQSINVESMKGFGTANHMTHDTHVPVKLSGICNYIV